MHCVKNNKSTPTDDVRAVSAAVQVIDVDLPDNATKGEARPDVIDVDAQAATLNACTSGAIGASSPPHVIDVDGPAATVKGSLTVIDVDANPLTRLLFNKLRLYGFVIRRRRFNEEMKRLS